MKHPFEVGNTYRNELGEYEVVSIKEPDMVIRYSDGGEREAEIAFQRRVWERIQDEEEIKLEAEQRKSKSKTKRRSSTARYGAAFHGLAETDFQTSIKGTNWRARSGLGGLLAVRLSTLSGRIFESRAVARQPRVFITLPYAAAPKAPSRKAKFILGLDEAKAYHGFYIEKNFDEMDDSWDWPQLITALGDDLALRHTLQDAMEEYDLGWKITLFDSDHEFKSTAIVTAESGGLALRTEGNDQIRPLEWADFVAYLDELDDEEWCDLYLVQSISKTNAIELGVAIADEIAAVWNALLPLYDACAQSG